MADNDAPSLTAEGMAESRIIQLKNMRQKQEELKKISQLMDDQFDIAQRSLKIEEFALAKLSEKLKEQIKLNKKNNLTQEQSAAKMEAYVKSLNLSVKHHKLLNAELAKAGGTLEDVVDKIEEVRGKLAASEEISKDFERSLSGMASKMGVSAKFADTMAGKFTSMFAGLAHGDKEKTFELMSASLASMMSPLNIAGMMLDKMIKSALELDKVSKQFQKTSGGASDMSGALVANREEFAGMGITIGDVGKSMTALRDNFRGINQLSEDQIKNLTKNTSILAKYGVSTGTSTKMQKGFMKSLKMTDIEATHMTSRLAKNAGAVGVSSSKMAEDFQASFGYLSMYGDRSVEVFENLAAQAANAGIEIAKMIEITKAFDKFSSGAEKAARMNAVFGTNISSMAMMTMDAGQRMEYLTEQVQNSVGSLEALSQAQKLSLTESMGFGNVAEMMAALGANTKEAHDMRAKMETQGNIEQNMANALEGLLPFMEQITAEFDRLAGNPEAIQNITGAIQGLVSVAIFLIKHLKKITSAFIAYNTVALLASIRTGALTLQIKLNALAKLSGTLATETATAAKWAYARATAAAGLKLLVFAGIIYYMIKLLTKPNSPPFYLIFGVIAIAVIFFGRALDSMGPKAIVAAIALALLAGAISLIFYGISSMVKAVTGLFTVLIGAIDVLPQLALGMYALGGAFLFLGISAMASSAGILMGLGALTIMMGVLALTGTSMKDMMGMGDGILKIGQGIEKFGSGLQSIKSAAAEIKSALGDTMMMASMEGAKMSVVIGKQAGIATLFKNDTLNIKVDMPEINIPTPNFTIEIDGEAIDARIYKTRTGAV